MKKYNIIRTEIKRLSELQVTYKAQRKEKHLKGKRTMDAYQATLSAQLGKHSLMHLYMAYAKLKGVELPLPVHKEVNQSLVDGLVKKYYVAPEPVE